MSQTTLLGDFPIPGLLVFLGAALVGAPVAFLVLRALQRRYRVFTRGTIAFMVTVLVGFGTLDLIDFLNDVRNDERRLVAQAEARMVVAATRALLDDAVEPPAGVEGEALDAFAALREALRARLLELDADAGTSLELVRVQAHAPGPLSRRVDAHFSRNWGVVAWLGDGERLARFRGTVASYRGADGSPRIASLDGAVDPATTAMEVMPLPDAHVWQSERWSFPGWGPGHLPQRR